MAKFGKTFKVEEVKSDGISTQKVFPTKSIDLDSLKQSDNAFASMSEKELVYKIKYELDGEELENAKEILAKKFGKIL
jgi:hypothetical protein